MGALAIVGAVVLVVVFFRFLFSVPDDETPYEQRTRTGMTPIGAGEELDMVFGSGTPSLGPPPPPARLEPEAHTEAASADVLRPPWLDDPAG